MRSFRLGAATLAALIGGAGVVVMASILPVTATATSGRSYPTRCRRGGLEHRGLDHVSPRQRSYRSRQHPGARHRCRDGLGLAHARRPGLRRAAGLQRGCLRGDAHEHRLRAQSIDGCRGLVEEPRGSPDLGLGMRQRQPHWNPRHRRHRRQCIAHLRGAIRT